MTQQNYLKQLEDQEVISFKNAIEISQENARKAAVKRQSAPKEVPKKSGSLGLSDMPVLVVKKKRKEEESAHVSVKTTIPTGPVSLLPDY